MAIPDLNTYTGLTVFANPLLTDTKIRDVPRTWKERLFSWPWRPQIATRKEVYQVPSEKIYVMGDKIICHPDFANKLREAMAERTETSNSIKW